jgi:hypothetical protein
MLIVLYVEPLFTYQSIHVALNIFHVYLEVATQIDT